MSEDWPFKTILPCDWCLRAIVATSMDAHRESCAERPVEMVYCGNCHAEYAGAHGHCEAYTWQPSEDEEGT